MHEGLALAHGLVTATIAGDHKTAQALAIQYATEHDMTEVAVWQARYAAILLQLLARTDPLERSAEEFAEMMALRLASGTDDCG